MSEEHSSALRSTMEDIIAIYEWCSVDPADRGYSALDNEILRAKRLLATTALPSTGRPSPDSKLEAYRKALELAEEALSSCYEVMNYPADGSTSKDVALAEVRKALAAGG